MTLTELRQKMPDIEIIDKTTGKNGKAVLRGCKDKFAQVCPIVNDRIQIRSIPYSWETVLHKFNNNSPIKDWWQLELDDTL